MSIKEKLDQFQKLKKEISEYFDVNIYDGFDDNREYRWFVMEEYTIG